MLAAGSMMFKLHSTVLAPGSGVFADLFALGRPEANEAACSGAAPTIPVHDDANYWLEVLPWFIAACKYTYPATGRGCCPNKVS